MPIDHHTSAGASLGQVFFFFVETTVILTFNQTVLKLVESYQFSVFMVELVFFGGFFLGFCAIFDFISILD